jgi:hypothetical protein
MGCGASVTSIGICRKSIVSVPEVDGEFLTITSTNCSFLSEVRHYNNYTDQQIKALCFSTVDRIFRNKPSKTAAMRSNPRRKRTEDSRFIEQRIPIESDDETDDAATNSTTVTYLCNAPMSPCGTEKTSTEKTASSNPRSFFQIALNYNKRIEEVRLWIDFLFNFLFRSEISVPKRLLINLPKF